MDLFDMGIAEARIRLAPNDQDMTLRQCDDLFDYIEHGDKNHRKWLRYAIYSWVLGYERPKEIKDSDDVPNGRN